MRVAQGAIAAVVLAASILVGKARAGESECREPTYCLSASSPVDWRRAPTFDLEANQASFGTLVDKRWVCLSLSRRPVGYGHQDCDVKFPIPIGFGLPFVGIIGFNTWEHNFALKGRFISFLDGVKSKSAESIPQDILKFFFICDDQEARFYVYIYCWTFPNIGKLYIDPQTPFVVDRDHVTCNDRGNLDPRSLLSPVSIDRSSGGRSRQMQAVEKASNAGEGKEGLPLGPPSGICCAVRSLPLGAKIGTSIILALGAWGVVFSAWDRFDGFNGRRRSRKASLGLLLLALVLFGGSAALFGLAFP